MNQREAKMYENLHKKIEAIYLGATGGFWVNDGNPTSLCIDDAKRFMDSVGNIDEVVWKEFTERFNNLNPDGIEDVDVVTDWLFERGIRA